MEDEQGGPSGNVLLQLEACGKRENIVCTKPVLIIVGHSVLFLVFVGLSLRSRLHRRANRAMKEVALFHDRLLDLGSVWASLSWVVGVVLTVLPGCEDTPLRFGFLVVHYTLRGVRVFLFVSVFVFLTAESVGRQATHRASQIGFFSACLFNLRVLLLLFDTSHYATARAVMHALLTMIFGVLIYNHWSRPHRPHNVGQGQELLAHFLTPTQRTHDEEEPSSSSVQPPTSHQNYHRPFVVRFASKWWRPARHSFSSLAYKRHLHPFGLVVALSTFVGGLSSLMEAIGSYNTCVAFRVIEYVFLYVLFPLALHYTLLMDYRMCESVLCRAEGFNNLKRIPYEKLKLGDAIASGSQGTVHQAEYEGQRVCVKKFYMPDQQRTRQKFEMEASMYGALDHPNIIQIIGICENEANVLLVLELCEEGDLYKYIHNSPKVLTYAMAQRFMRELASALDHVHSSTVAHRDLKTTNVLLKQGPDGHLHVKLADFEASHFEGSITQSSQQPDLFGTLEWMAPELVSTLTTPQSRTAIMPKKAVSLSACDVYAFGVIIYELLNRCDPPRRSVQDSRQISERYRPEQYCTTITADGTPVHPRLQALLLSCVATDPLARPSIGAVIQTLEQIERDERPPLGHFWKS